ncbi:RidA family protein [Thermoproteota archaeon]
MEIIQTAKASQPLGHYSQAVVHNGLVYVSGQLGIKLDNPAEPAGDIEAQTKCALQNLDSILIECGSSKHRVLKTTVYIADLGLWKRVNQVYAEFFGEHKPARSAVPVKELPRNFLVEIDAIAAV